MPDSIKSNDNTLDEDAFQGKTFTGQQSSSLFAPHAKELVASLHKILSGMYSQENLDFLLEIHKLNADQKMSSEKRTLALTAIENKYIANPKTRLNIDETVIKQIINSQQKSLADYEKAVKQVISLINSNVKPTAELLKIDRSLYLIHELCPELMGGLNNVAAMRNQSQHKEYRQNFEACQKKCKSASQELGKLISNTSSYEKNANKFVELILNVVPLLSEKLAAMHTFELQNPHQEKLSSHIENVIKDFSLANAILVGRSRPSPKSSKTTEESVKDPTTSNSLQSRSLPSIASRTSSNSNSQDSKSTPWAKTPSLSSRKTFLPPIKSSPYRKSSRALEEQKEKNEEYSESPPSPSPKRK